MNERTETGETPLTVEEIHAQREARAKADPKMQESPSRYASGAFVHRCPCIRVAFERGPNGEPVAFCLACGKEWDGAIQ